MIIGSELGIGYDPGQHELGLEHCPGGFNSAVEGGRHPTQHRMLNLALHVR